MGLRDLARRVVEALADPSDGTIVDAELAGPGDTGRPDFHVLQNLRGAAFRIYYYIFDLLCRGDRDLIRPPVGRTAGAPTAVLIVPVAVTILASSCSVDHTLSFGVASTRRV